jgi:polyisoprenoid-binding protein YceI
MRFLGRSRRTVSGLGQGLRALALLAALATTVRAEPATWAIDKDYTNVTFSWNHVGLSRQSARMLDVSGVLTLDPTNPEQGAIDVVLRVASLWTGVEVFDKLLRSSDFFDAAKHPAITFRSTGVRRITDKTGEVDGDLTIMGLAKPVTLKVTWNFTGEHPLGAINANYKDKFVSGFSASTRLMRSEWGIKRGIPLASDEIEITIEAELIRK